MDKAEGGAKPQAELEGGQIYSIDSEPYQGI